MMLCFLSEHHRISLLKNYLCLRPPRELPLGRSGSHPTNPMLKWGCRMEKAPGDMKNPSSSVRGHRFAATEPGSTNYRADSPALASLGALEQVASSHPLPGDLTRRLTLSPSAR
jgi:hypothetical protein